ncbi:glutamate racemase [Gallaecimonas sp. GXIMD4217]|uniref:glutamate racemase n=1 Tax=Gallaecimonas sp. GXIMD4217 TaxID=3131927 RepID=UPI00311B1A94
MSQLLFFDSGVGGLSVWREVQQLLPGLSSIYCMDDEAFPYGELAEPVLVRRVLGAFEALTARHDIELAVVACNSASTLVLPALREHFDFPIVGVVPAIKPAAGLSRTGHIGLLATPGTVRRPYTRQLIAEFAPHCQVSLIGSSELVTQAERKLRGQGVQMAKLEEVLRPWLDSGPDVVVLGCTHFPLLREEIGQILGSRVQLVDSGTAIANRVRALVGDIEGEGGMAALYHSNKESQGLDALKGRYFPGAALRHLPLAMDQLS